MDRVQVRGAGEGDRRRFLLGAAGLGVTGLGGCSMRPSAPPPVLAPSKPRFRAVPPLAALDARPERIMNITVCLRPFRAQGPRLDAERVGDKLVVHNYGHGGSGWSLCWGSAREVVPKALSTGERDIAVIGCGALGISAAITAQRAGANVIIYAKERMPDVRSSRATGVWSPDSRVARADAVGPEFASLWERMTRASFRTYTSYLGLPGAPVEWIDRYVAFDAPAGRRSDPVGFVHYRSTADLTPPSETLTPESHPFASPIVRRAAVPMFNISELSRVLMAEFLMTGGRIETVEFHTPADLAKLKQKVIIDCTGYGARALWKDESIVPVRGQIAWLIPQPDVNYGLIYDNVSMLGRRDGVVIQQTGPDEGWGYNDPNESPDRAEAEAAVRAIARAYRRAA